MKKELPTRKYRVSYNPLPDGTLYFIDFMYIPAGDDFIDAASIIAKCILNSGRIFYNIRPTRIMLKFPQGVDGYETMLDFISAFNRHPKRPFTLEREGDWEKCDWTLYSHGELSTTLTIHYVSPDDF